MANREWLADVPFGGQIDHWPLFYDGGPNEKNKEKLGEGSCFLKYLVDSIPVDRRLKVRPPLALGPATGMTDNLQLDSHFPFILGGFPKRNAREG